MQVDRRALRSLRHALVGLANGASLVFLAVFAAAYGQESIPLASVEEFLRVATTLAGRPPETTLVWMLAYLGLALIVLSPTWLLLVRPVARALLQFEFSTAPIERSGDDETARPEDGTDATGPDRRGTGSVRGGAAGGQRRTFSLDDVSEEGEPERGRVDTE